MRNKRHIFLTGATGLLGGEIAGRLRARGHSVTALVNRCLEVRRNDGSLIPTQSFNGASKRPGTLSTIKGDLGQHRLGWNDITWSQVAAEHDLVLHCAAVTGFDADEADYRSVNVEGTEQLAALAGRGGMQLLHVSTAYVCGMHDGPVLETPTRCGRTFANGYEASKAAAERVIRRSGIPAAIARPSIVVGDSDTGAIRTFDRLYLAFKLVAEGRIRRMPASQGATLDFVPIDYVAEGIVALADRMNEATGGIFALVSGAPVSLEQFGNAIAAYPQFTPPLFVEPQNLDLDALPPLQRRLHALIASSYGSYFQRRPEFKDDAFRALTGMACRSTGPAFLTKLIDYCIAVGFLKGERPAQAVLD